MGHPSGESQESHADATALVAALRELGSAAVAFSAGVDSTVVAKGAQLALGEHALAVTGVGPALASGELAEARSIAARIGIQHAEMPTDEINDPLYLANGRDRCYHCKTELYGHVRQAADQHGIEHLVNGANADDRSDHRPGMIAADQHRVHSPLMDLGIGKERVRLLARYWGLPLWDKPATPCLASRLVYGLPVTPERLARVDAAEHWLKGLRHEGQALREVRVRYHANDEARVEVPLVWVPRLLAEPLQSELTQQLLRLGFQHVTVDPAGFRSGGLNDLVTLSDPPTTAPQADS